MSIRKTPPYKRIKRAEEGREEWKVKAIERREEIECLKGEINKTSNQLNDLNQLNQNLQDKLKAADKRIKELEELLKKKKYSKISLKAIDTQQR